MKLLKDGKIFTEVVSLLLARDDMIEGPGHVPMNMIKENVELQDKLYMKLYFAHFKGRGMTMPDQVAYKCTVLANSLGPLTIRNTG